MSGSTGLIRPPPAGTARQLTTWRNYTSRESQASPKTGNARNTGIVDGRKSRTTCRRRLRRTKAFEAPIFCNVISQSALQRPSWRRVHSSSNCGVFGGLVTKIGGEVTNSGPGDCLRSGAISAAWWGFSAAGCGFWGLGSYMGRSPRLDGDFRRRGADLGAWALIWGDLRGSVGIFGAWVRILGPGL